jgi:rubrerythrin
LPLKTSDELTELLDTAIYKEVSSQALYLGAQKRTEDPGARELMRELAGEELKHAQLLKDLREKGSVRSRWNRDEVPNLRISDYLTDVDTLEGAGLQDTLTFAIKREQQSIEFYSRMMSLLKGQQAKRLCERLVHYELKHKLRLETFYDSFFYGED